MGLYLGKEKVSNVASVITLSAEGMAAEMQNHIANTDIHITADERTKWNAATEDRKELPSVSTSDNGKFLRVVNGVWTASSINNANGVSF